MKSQGGKVNYFQCGIDLTVNLLTQNRVSNLKFTNLGVSLLGMA